VCKRRSAHRRCYRYSERRPEVGVVYAGSQVVLGKYFIILTNNHLQCNCRPLKASIIHFNSITLISFITPCNCNYVQAPLCIWEGASVQPHHLHCLYLRPWCEWLERRTQQGLSVCSTRVGLPDESTYLTRHPVCCTRV